MWFVVRMRFMHPFILGVGLAALASAADGAGVEGRAGAGRCPPPQAAVHEHFIAAGCADCWSQPEGTAAGATAGGGGWRFDWIAPGGADAPLSTAALPEAQERLDRRGSPPPDDRQPTLLRQPAAAPPPAGLRLTVESGLPWAGYLGLQMRLSGSGRSALPPGSVGWLALVELLPEGSEGSPVARALVRSVAGPLPLDSFRSGRGLSHLRALRWPETALPERLQARGWIEAADGRMLAVAADRCR